MQVLFQTLHLSEVRLRPYQLHIESNLPFELIELILQVRELSMELIDLFSVLVE